MKWTKYIPAFLITGLLFLLLSVIIKNTVLVISLRVVSFILIILNIVFYCLFKKWDYSNTKMNKIFSTIMLPVIPLIVIELFVLLFELLSPNSSMKINNYEHKTLDLSRGTHIYLKYEEFSGELISYDSFSGGEYLVEILNDDTINKEYTLKITYIDKYHVAYDISITSEINSYNDYNYELKELYLDNILTDYTVVDNEKVYDCSACTSNEYVDIKMVYEAKINYIEVKDYKALFLKANHPYSIDMTGFDDDCISDLKRRHKQREYVIYEVNMPSKYTMPGYDYYVTSIVLAYIIYITSTIVVVGKTICFFMYYKSKEVEAE